MTRPIRAIDGEADLPDEEGRQNYNLMVAGSRMIRPQVLKYLTSFEIFEFLLNLPKDDYLVGYYTGYDVTHWLRNVPQKKCDSILADNNFRIFGNYTWFKQYGIWYIPGQFFRVCRIQPGVQPPKILAGSDRTVNEISGFWRGPFLEALATMATGSAGEIAEIKAGKEARGKVELPAQQLERYCKLETRLMGKAATKLRDQFEDCGFPLRDYRGAGAAASAILNANPQIPKRPDKPTRPARIDVVHEEHRYPDDTRWRQAVMTAFSGGRIENRAYGKVDGQLFVNDINSAYPAALLTTPCPKHTVWVKFRGEPKGWKYYLAQGSWQTKERIAWGPLPTRTKEQAIVYPRSVEGYWWHPELEGLEGFQFKGGWGADKECDCDPFWFVRDIYEERLRLGPVAGMPLKVGLAAVTGKFAESRRPHSARWRDLVVAGITYSQTRRWVRDALTDDAMSVATDAIFSKKPLALIQGNGLGEWQVTRLKDGFFFVKPGIGWTPDLSNIKARGFSKNDLIAEIKNIEELWARWNPLAAPPSYTINVDMFHSHKAAAMLRPYKDNNAPTEDELAARAALVGTWRKMQLPLSFEWQPRRHPDIQLMGSHILTFAPERHQKAVPYDPSMISEMEKLDILLWGQPDG